MKCPYCNRKPNEIPEYIQGAEQNEMSANEYVRMDEGTYHLETDMFCCTDCYIKQGLPLNTQLIMAFRFHRSNVVQLEGR